MLNEIAWVSSNWFEWVSISNENINGSVFCIFIDKLITILNQNIKNILQK